MPGMVSGAGSWGFNAAVPPSLRGLLLWWEGIEGKGHTVATHSNSKWFLLGAMMGVAALFIYDFMFPNLHRACGWARKHANTHTHGEKGGKTYLRRGKLPDLISCFVILFLDFPVLYFCFGMDMKGEETWRRKREGRLTEVSQVSWHL